MAVHIDQITSEVIPEAEPASSGTGEGSSLVDMEQLREMQTILFWDRRRTAAEGYDD